MKRRVGVAGSAAVLMVVVVLLSGCGTSSGSAGSAAVSNPGAGSAVGEAAPADRAASGKAAAAGTNATIGTIGTSGTNGTSATIGTNTVTDQQRTIVRTAEVTVLTAHPDGAADVAVQQTKAAGGRVDSDVRTDTAHLVLRVPAAAMDAVLADLDQLGRRTARTVSGEDVTAQQADTTARVAALQTSVGRLEQLLGQSAGLTDLLQLEQQLTQRQGDLESMQAQQRALADQVALASITLDLRSEPAAAKAGPPGFGTAVSGGWHGTIVAGRYLLAILGYGWPFVVLLVLLVVLLRLRRGRAGSPASGPPASGPPAGGPHPGGPHPGGPPAGGPPSSGPPVPAPPAPVPAAG